MLWKTNTFIDIIIIRAIKTTWDTASAKGSIMSKKGILNVYRLSINYDIDTLLLVMKNGGSQIIEKECGWFLSMLNTMVSFNNSIPLLSICFQEFKMGTQRIYVHKMFTVNTQWHYPYIHTILVIKWVLEHKRMFYYMLFAKVVCLYYQKMFTNFRLIRMPCKVQKKPTKSNISLFRENDLWYRHSQIEKAVVRDVVR